MKSKLLRYSGPVALALGLLAVLALTAQLTVFCDDYIYGVFFRGGPGAFWERTVWHYCNFNGRTFVHFICQLALLFDTKLYMVLCPAMLAFIFMMGQRLQGRDNPWWITLLTSGACALAVVALPLNFLRNSLMWVSAGFNYIFPPCVMLFALWLFQRNFSSSWAWVGVGAAAFLAGATTEQTGFASMVVLFGWGLLALIRRQLPFWKAVLPGVLASVGYATIIFAPGTWVRVGKEVNGGILSLLHWEEFQYRFWLSMRFLTGIEGLPVLFVVFGLLFGMWLGLRKHSLLWALPGVGAAAAYILLMVTGHYFLSQALTVLAFAAAGIFCLFQPETTNRGLLILGMLGSQLIMLLNRSAAERTALPAILLLLTVCASMLADCFAVLGRFSWIAPAVTACILAVLLPFYLPTLIGYAKNTPVVRANEREWRDKSDDVIKLSMDLDEEYSYTNYLTSDKYLEDAIEYYDVAGQRITYYSEDKELAGLQGFCPGRPVYIEDGKVYLPIQSTLIVCGGESDWDMDYSGFFGELGDKSYFIANNGKIFYWDAENETPGEAMLGNVDIRLPYMTHYAEAEAFCDLFGLELTYNQDENVYYIRLNGDDQNEE